MSVTYERYIDYLKNNNIRHNRVKIEFLRYEDETVFSDVTGDVIDSNGSLNVSNKNGTRRSISFQLSNLDKLYIPNQDTFYIRQKIKVYTGFIIDGEDVLFEQGIFVMQDPSISGSGDGSTVTISAIDKFCLADGTMGGEIDGIFIIPVGTSIPEAIRLSLKPSDNSQKEIFYDWKNPIIDVKYDTYVTPYTIELATGDAISDIFIQLADMVGANVFYNKQGYLVFEEDIDDSNKGSIFDFEKGDFNYIENNRTYSNSKVYNACLVIGANVDGDIATGYLENTDLLSDTSIPNVGYKRVLYISDSNISTDILAISRAKYELKRVTNLQSENTLTSVPIPDFDVDNVITITDDRFNLYRERNLINSISIPIGNSGSMSIGCAKSVEIILSEV